MPEPDPRAVRILLDAYWTSGGWRSDPRPSPDDLEYAVAAGVMYRANRSLAHDEVVDAVLELAAQVSLDETADAFLASLTSRRLDLRSALASRVLAEHLIPHEFVMGPDRRCAVCDLLREELDVDLNVMNFERFKWGGVRRLDFTYLWLDLEQFARADRPRPTDSDRSAFRRLLDDLAGMPPGTTAAKAATTTWDGIPSNKAERGALIDVLGVCSVLETPDHRGFLDRFVPAAERDEPPYHYVERTYPACWWRSEHGVNRQSAQRLGLA